MKPGSRSIRGALSTYAWVAGGATLALALALGWLWRDEAAGAAVQLPAGGPFVGATLDDGWRTHRLLPGATLRLPAGSYRVTLFDAAGGDRRGLLQLGARDAILPGDLSALEPGAR